MSNYVCMFVPLRLTHCIEWCCSLQLSNNKSDYHYWFSSYWRVLCAYLGFFFPIFTGYCWYLLCSLGFFFFFLNPWYYSNMLFDFTKLFVFLSCSIHTVNVFLMKHTVSYECFVFPAGNSPASQEEAWRTVQCAHSPEESRCPQGKGRKITVHLIE